MTDDVDNLAARVYDLRRAFLRMNLKPPSVIILEDADSGYALERAVARHLHVNRGFYVNPDFKPIVEHPDGTVWRQLKLVDVLVRWPAMKWAQPGGGYTWR